MAVICLTGKGMDNGRQVDRPEWQRRIEAAGHRYTANAANCDVLVASRHDTIKIVNAKARGARVETYDWLIQFLAMHPHIGAQAVSPPAAPNPIDTREMEDNPLWGMF